MIIVALVAVATIAVYQYFDQTIGSQTFVIANEVAGQSSKPAITEAAAAALKADGEFASKGLSNYVDCVFY